MDLTRLGLDNFVFRDESGTRRIADTCVRAVMLPFSSEACRQRFTLTDNIGIKDHPTVRNWTIASDGSIRIRRASIVASWPHSTAGDYSQNAIMADVAANTL